MHYVKERLDPKSFYISSNSKHKLLPNQNRLTSRCNTACRCKW